MTEQAFINSLPVSATIETDEQGATCIKMPTSEADVRLWARVYGVGAPNLASMGLGRRGGRVLAPNRVQSRLLQTEPAEWLIEPLLGHGKNLYAGRGQARSKSHANKRAC